MKSEKFNGYKNRDTWLVALWLDNDRRNYGYIAKNRGILLAQLKPDLVKILKRLHYGDKINWNNVNITEIKQVIRDTK